MANAVLWLNPRRARWFAPDMPLADKFKIRVWGMRLSLAALPAQVLWV